MSFIVTIFASFLPAIYYTVKNRFYSKSGVFGFVVKAATFIPIPLYDPQVCVMVANLRIGVPT